jgi:L-ribulose-5-phosphate 3-epimerase
MPLIGIMQGRLLPPFEGRFQSFPAERWRDEFESARTAGLDTIEWIYERYHEADNPVATDDGIAEIERLSRQFGVAVRSICADYYMQACLIVNGEPSGERVEHLKWLLTRAETMGLIYVILPFVDQSALRTANDKRALRDVLTEILPHAGRRGVELHLETDFPPLPFAELLGELNHPMLKANYDIGNSAALGFDPTEELTRLRPWLGSVHVKDRVRGGGTVPLGTGNADLPTCFRLIQEAGYARPYIMQVARDRDGGEVAWARSNRTYIERQLALLAA